MQPTGGNHGGEAAEALRALAALSRRISEEPDPDRALWELVTAARAHTGIDRIGIFAAGEARGVLERVVGVDEHGQPEYSGQRLDCSEPGSPAAEVVARRRPYSYCEDVTREFPAHWFRPGVRAHVVVPILAGGSLLGILCGDNCLTERPIPEAAVEPLFLYAGLAALPLFAVYQQREARRAEALRLSIARDVLHAVTEGRFALCTAEEIAAEWPAAGDGMPIRQEEDVRRVREAVQAAADAAAIPPCRAGDLVLCASEAATNALLHGGGGAATVEARGDRVRVRIADHGRGINTEDLPRATLQKGWSTGRSMGLGFTIIHETADRVFMHTGPGGTTLIIEMGSAPEGLAYGGGNPITQPDP